MTTFCSCAFTYLLYCYGAQSSPKFQVFGAIKANSQSQNQSTHKTRNTFSATAPAPTNSANMMRATKVDSKPTQARNAALIAKRAQCIPLHLQSQCLMCVQISRLFFVITLSTFWQFCYGSKNGSAMAMREQHQVATTKTLLGILSAVAAQYKANLEIYSY